MDSFLRMQLLDLARTLTRKDSLQLELSYHSHFDSVSNKVTVSQFWSDFPEPDRVSGCKSDVYLRSIGSAWFSSSTAIEDFMKRIETIPLPSFARQLFALGEDIRLEQICTRVRPGTAKIFAVRKRLYSAYFTNQIRMHVRSQDLADAFFCAVYLSLATGINNELLQEHLRELLDQLEPDLDRLKNAKSTDEVADSSLDVIEAVTEVIKKDMSRSYFSIQPANGVIEPLPQDADRQDFDESLERSKKLENEETNASDENPHTQKEEMPAWHRETGEQPQNMLQFELEHGTRTDIVGDTIRETDPGDQALALVQGVTRFSSRNEFSKEEELNKRLAELTLGGQGSLGIFNEKARPVWKTAEPVSEADFTYYQQMKERIGPLQRKLTRTIQLSLELKKTAARSNLPYGRLSKNLVRVVTDKNPRLFYKKSNPTNRIDAAFALLVDCSASMFDKMQGTQLGITLFHETLRYLQIPHAVIGFWEDSQNADPNDYPNIFHVILDFASSLSGSAGPKILQLEPQQDNRDGFAIRIVSNYLRNRSEKNRVLLVFSDGEPAAADYHENGILDTYQAVLEARRQSIDVIGVYLANDEVSEEERQMMRNIYGHSSVIVPQVEQLTEHLTPVLRKLLFKGI
ncbi:vWA domain-containing protein [Effusibacillus consociatus]|uniref:VWA domain-containing protein n=1 Tax=Effusibacillus consociatus TaxID=1117041 RepID=A0ABV9PXU8_9BACL